MPHVGAIIAIIVLLGLGYIAGRTIQTGDQRFSYLAVGTFIAVVIGVVGLVMALDSVIDIAVPQKVASGRPGGRALRLQLPALTRRGGDGGSQMQFPFGPDARGGGITIGGGDRSNATHDVRDHGIVGLLRGLVLIIGAGAFLYAFRRLMPAVPEPPAPPRTRAART